MQKRFTVCALTMLSITCGAALAAQLTPAQKVDRVTTLLKSLETRDAVAAAATRRRLLEDAARNGYIVAPDQLPFPGLGHIRKDGHAYTWVPVDYVNDAVEK
jgi:hypothetical protein